MIIQKHIQEGDTLKKIRASGMQQPEQTASNFK